MASAPSGKPFIAFDNSGRPVIGFSKTQAETDISKKGEEVQQTQQPIYDSRHRYFVTDFDDDNNSILGFTRDNKPIYDISSTGYVALGIDRTTRKLVYGFNWMWKPVFEQELRQVEQVMRQRRHVAKDEHGNRVFGFDEHGNMIYTFSSDDRPIFGYNRQRYPIFGLNPHGHQVLTFDDQNKPVYGFDVNESPIYDLNTFPADAVVYFPPGNEIDIREALKVYDVWGRPVHKDRLMPKASEDRMKPRRNSDGSIVVDLYDRTGKPLVDMPRLNDQNGKPMHNTQIITDAQGRWISADTAVLDKSGQPLANRPQQQGMPSTQFFDQSGRPLGVVTTSSVVINHNNQPIGIAINPRKLVTLVHPQIVQSSIVRGDEVFDQQGRPVGRVEQDGTVVDMVGALIGSVGPNSSVIVDQDLVDYHQSTAQQQRGFPQATANNFFQNNASNQDQTNSQQGGQAHNNFSKFRINTRGLVLSENGTILGQVCPIEPQPNVTLHPMASQFVKDQRGSIIAQILHSGEIVSVEGPTIGWVGPQVDMSTPAIQALNQVQSSPFSQQAQLGHPTGQDSILRDIYGIVVGKIYSQPAGPAAVVSQSGERIGTIFEDGSVTSLVGHMLGKVGTNMTITSGVPGQHPTSQQPFSQYPQQQYNQSNGLPGQTTQAASTPTPTASAKRIRPASSSSIHAADG